MVASLSAELHEHRLGVCGRRQRTSRDWLGSGTGHGPRRRADGSLLRRDQALDQRDRALQRIGCIHDPRSEVGPDPIQACPRWLDHQVTLIHAAPRDGVGQDMRSGVIADGHVLEERSLVAMTAIIAGRKAS